MSYWRDSVIEKLGGESYFKNAVNFTPEDKWKVELPSIYFFEDSFENFDKEQKSLIVEKILLFHFFSILKIFLEKHLEEHSNENTQVNETLLYFTVRFLKSFKILFKGKIINCHGYLNGENIKLSNFFYSADEIPLSAVLKHMEIRVRA